MQTYLVGGAVRDNLLDIPIKDRDWVVVGATPEAMIAAGYQQVGKGFPVFLHPETHEEYALARTERKTAPGHTGFEIHASPDVTLEEDLQRRDLTINAIAQTTGGELVDPYNGKADIEARKLRHVSDAFSEDPLRVLRVARFAARFADRGFTVADETMELMRAMVASGELESLVAERVWQELQRALTEATPAEFVRVLRQCHALTVILPEVNALFGVPQPKKYHPEVDTGEHILLCLQQARRLSKEPIVAYATLVHDVGKAITDPDKWPSHVGHEQLGLKLIRDIQSRLRVPKDYGDLALLVCDHHTKLHKVQELRPATLLKLLESLDAFRRPQRMDQFMLACEADARGRTGLEDRDYAQGEYLRTVLVAANTVNAREVLEQNPGAAPKDVISRARLAAITECVNELRTQQQDNAQ